MQLLKARKYGSGLIARYSGPQSYPHLGSFKNHGLSQASEPNKGEPLGVGPEDRYLFDFSRCYFLVLFWAGVVLFSVVIATIGRGEIARKSKTILLNTWIWPDLSLRCNWLCLLFFLIKRVFVKADKLVVSSFVFSPTSDVGLGQWVCSEWKFMTCSSHGGFVTEIKLSREIDSYKS